MNFFRKLGFTVMFIASSTFAYISFLTNKQNLDNFNTFLGPEIAEGTACASPVTCANGTASGTATATASGTATATGTATASGTATATSSGTSSGSGTGGTHGSSSC